MRLYEDERGKVSLLPFDTESTVDIEDVFVKLELEGESFFPGQQVKKTKLKSYDELFSLTKSRHKPVLRVVLKGGAGCGKTTLVDKIAYDWAQSITGKVTSPLSKFDLLFSLKMRYFDDDMSLVDAIFDQLLPSDSKVSRKGLERYLLENAEKVAVIFDGADEFMGKIEKSKHGNLVVDVVCNKMLCSSPVIITTRPHRVTSVNAFSWYSHVVVDGFSEDSIFEFIGKFFQVNTFKTKKELLDHMLSNTTKIDKTLSGENASLLDIVEETVGSNIDDEEDDYLESGSTAKLDADERTVSIESLMKTIFLQPVLNSLACIPVILTMFCLLWSECQTLPKRLTTLYQEVLHYFTQRWLEKSGNDIESEDMEADIFKQLGKVALMCLFENRLFFSATEFENKDVLDAARSIGILVEERKRSKLRLIKQYSFIHKTFQEFFAATYWASLADKSSAEFSEYLNRIVSRNDDSFEYVLLFCCGLSSDAADRILSHIVNTRSNSVLSGNRCQMNFQEYTGLGVMGSSWLLGVQLLFESQCANLVGTLSKWFSCDEIQISVLFSNFKGKETALNYFLRSLEDYIQSNGRNGTYSVINTKILTGSDSLADFLTGEGPVFKTCTQSTAKVVNVLLKYAKGNVALKCDIESSFDRTLPMTKSLIEMITTPFHTLIIEFSFMEQATTISMVSDERQKYDLMFENCLFGLGNSISQLKFGLKMCLVQMGASNKCARYDISPLLFGILSACEPNQTLIEGIATNCKFTSKVMSSFLRLSPDLEELRIASFLEKTRYPVIERLERSIVDDFQSTEGKNTFMDSIQLLTEASSLRRVNTLHLRLSLSCKSLKGTETAVRLLFSKLKEMSLTDGPKDIMYWKSLFRLLAHTVNSVRKLCLRGNVIGGEATTITTSPVFYPKVKLTNEVADIQQSLQGVFDWLPVALRLNNLGSTLREDAIKEFVPVLHNMNDLEGIDLSFTNLEPADVEMIACGITFCSHLKMLTLSNNNIGNSCSALSHALGQLHELSELHLNRTKLRNKGLGMLATCFPSLTGLKSLFLSGNSIMFKGTYTLSKELQHLPNLLTLDISCNPIGDLGVLALCAASRHVPQLKCLNLGDCAITSTGVLLLTQSFKFLQCLEKLHLEKNTMVDHNGFTWVRESLTSLRKPLNVHLFQADHYVPLKKWYEELN